MRIDGNIRLPKAAYYRIRSDFLAYEESVLFGDGFESGDTAAWSGSQGGS